MFSQMQMGNFKKHCKPKRSFRNNRPLNQRRNKKILKRESKKLFKKPSSKPTNYPKRKFTRLKRHHSKNKNHPNKNKAFGFKSCKPQNKKVSRSKNKQIRESLNYKKSMREKFKKFN